MGVTAEEVAAVLGPLHARLLPQLCRLSYVADHERAIDAAWSRWLSKGTRPLVRAPQPVSSPDFNRPVEHFHQPVKHALRQWCLVNDLPHSWEQYYDVLKTAAEGQDIESIREDVRKLPSLWDYVANSDGGWPPRDRR